MTSPPPTPTEPSPATSSELLDPSAVTAALTNLAAGWSGGVDALTRHLEFADFPTAVSFVDGIVEVCEERQHHPDLLVSWRNVTITLATHSAGGVPAKDVELAHELDLVAARLPQV